MSQVEAECQQVAERAMSREEELSGRVSALENGCRQADGQIKDLKETIFELEDQVEQQRAVHLHTNQTILDLESMFTSLYIISLLLYYLLYLLHPNFYLL